MVRVYWSRVAARAWNDTFHLLGLKAGWQLLLAIIVAAVAAVLIAVFRTPAAAADEVFNQMFIAAAVAVVLPIVFLFCFIRAPAKLDAERAAQIVLMHDAIKKYDRDEEIIEAAGALRQKAINLIADYNGGSEAERHEDQARDLLESIATLGNALDARSKAILLSEDWKAFDFQRWDGLSYEEEDRGPLEILALRTQAIERIWGF